MKKLLAMLVVLVLVMGMCACSRIKNAGNTTVPTFDYSQILTTTAPEDTEEITEEPTEELTEEPTEEITEEPTEEITEEPTEADSDVIDPDFKAAMDSYEAFFKEYCDVMNKYMKNPTDLTLLAEYTSFMQRSAEMTEAMVAWENEDLNAAEMAYYLEVTGRITEMLSNVVA